MLFTGLVMLIIPVLFPEHFYVRTAGASCGVFFCLIIGEIVGSANDEVVENLYRLLSGETVTSFIDTGVIYPEVQQNPYSVFSFLLIAGYLKIAKTYPQHDGNYMCDLAIPNKEISFVYEKEVLNRAGTASASVAIQQAIFTADTKKLQKLLEDYLLESVSSYDGASESFYHGMMLGLCAVLSSQYRIKSNYESGIGRFDIALIPNRKGNPGFLGLAFRHILGQILPDAVGTKADFLPLVGLDFVHDGFHGFGGQLSFIRHFSHTNGLVVGRGCVHEADDFSQFRLRFLGQIGQLHSGPHSNPPIVHHVQQGRDKLGEANIAHNELPRNDRELMFLNFWSGNTHHRQCDFKNRTFAGLASFGYESCLAKQKRNQCENYAKSSRNTLTDFVFCGIVRLNMTERSMKV